MSDEQVSEPTESVEELDAKADTRVILIVFATAILFAVHALSGFTFDF